MEDIEAKYDPTVVTGFSIRKSQDAWLETKKAKTGVNKSFMVQKALDLWIEREAEKDKERFEFQPQQEEGGGQAA